VPQESDDGGINLPDMSKMLKCAGNDEHDGTVKAEDDGDTVTFMFESPSKNLELLYHSPNKNPDLLHHSLSKNLGLCIAF